MTKITNGGPKDLFPALLKDDPEQQALSYAIERAMLLILQFSQRTLMYAAIDEQPEYILDYMAIESRALYYEENMDIATKRKIIKNSLAWYMKAGTQECVDELIETVFGEGKTIPWYEFAEGEGTPGTFDIITSTQMTSDMYERLTRIIERAKNKSSVLRYVGIEHELECERLLFTGMCVQEQELISNDIHLDNPERVIFLNEYVSVSEDGQVDDKTIVGSLDTVIEQYVNLMGTCVLAAMEEMTVYETTDEAETNLALTMADGMFTQTEQTIGSEA